jgi:hypothetical protein
VNRHVTHAQNALKREWRGLQFSDGITTLSITPTSTIDRLQRPVSSVDEASSFLDCDSSQPVKKVSLFRLPHQYPTNTYCLAKRNMKVRLSGGARLMAL